MDEESATAAGGVADFQGTKNGQTIEPIGGQLGGRLVGFEVCIDQPMFYQGQAVSFRDEFVCAIRYLPGPY